MKKFIYLFSIILFLVLFLQLHTIFAAEIFFEQEKSPGLENQFKMGVFLKTEELLNAIEGKIRFPVNLLGLKTIENGNSIVTVWLERPTAGEAGEITFSGITPGGYQGSKGFVFSMTFLVKQEGIGAFDIHNVKVLRNDGKGTEAKLQTFSSKFIISRKTNEIQIPISEVKDINPPESFVPEIARDESIFNGKQFIVFATQDKASGVDRYEVKESRQKILTFFSRWRAAESPYILQDQELRSYVFVKAVDKAGNERIAEINPQHSLGWYENYENWIIIILGLVIVYAIKRFLWRKYIKA